MVHKEAVSFGEQLLRNDYVMHVEHCIPLVSVLAQGCIGSCPAMCLSFFQRYILHRHVAFTLIVLFGHPVDDAHSSFETQIINVVVPNDIALFQGNDLIKDAFYFFNFMSSD